MPGSPWGNQHNIFNVTDTTVSPHEMMRPQHNIFNVTDTTVSPHEMMRLQHNIFNPLNAELNPISYLLELLGAHHFLHKRGITAGIFKQLLNIFINMYI